MSEKNGYKKALNASFRLLSRRDHSIFELKEKLSKKGFSFDEIDSAVKRLIELDYLDELEFAKGFVRHCQVIRNLGSYRIRHELKKKRIPSRLMDKAMEEYNYETENETINRIVDSMAGSGKPAEKIARYLGNKGFPYDKIKEQMRNNPDVWL